ncbi:hypothetical protein ACHAXT_012685 [Thalassiosira profunda]
MMAPINPHDGISTTLANPGIVDRLEADIADYLSPFGFRLERLVGDSGAAVLEAPRPPDGPIGTLHLHVHSESLLPTVGPLLRTYLRLSPSHVHPQRYRAVVHCDFVLDALEKFGKMSSEQKRNQLGRQEEASARRMAHYVHMLVRNSMGSALCMDLIVILPSYRKRTLQDDTPVDTAPLTIDSVRLAMRDSPEANYYPSVQLVEPGENRVGKKVGNLHRILMLCHDYDEAPCGTIKTGDSSFLSNVVVVLPSANDDGMSNTGNDRRSKALCDFEDAVDQFHKTIVDPKRDDDDEAHKTYRPPFVYEDEAREEIYNIIQQRRTHSRKSQCMIGIDLHPDALTLNGDYATTESQALEQMKKADAIVFGYESTGIPSAIANALTDWVEIPSRSSINVVAALSIILDALLGSRRGGG